MYDSEFFRFKTIVDWENFLGGGLRYLDVDDTKLDLPFSPYLKLYQAENLLGRLYLYRINGQLRDNTQNLTLGLQRIFLGVGRLWTPLDTYNPTNALSVEKDERLGVFGGNYVYNLGDLSYLQVMGNFGKKFNLDKSGVLYKFNFNKIDTGVTYIGAQNFNMTGIELESNLFDTGVEVRSEITYFWDYQFKRNYPKGILGCDYAFLNNYTITAEYFYNGLGANNPANYNPGIITNLNWNLARHYLGLVLTDQFNPLLILTLSSIYNLVDSSLFTGFTFNYSIGDNTTLISGVQLFWGGSKSEFGAYSQYLYAKLSHYF
ncbi:MAG: hypothetical protein WC860_04530 [Candidatus Margulisiibacteriota bacterium]